MTMLWVYVSVAQLVLLEPTLLLPIEIVQSAQIIV